MAALRTRFLATSTFIATIVLLLFGVFSQGVTPDDLSEYAGQIVSHVRPGGSAEKLAYMTFLTGTMANLSDPDPDHDHDRYFVATRILGYQILHQPSTKTQKNIPFVVLVTDDISAGKQELLRQDGATVIKIEYLRRADWTIGEMLEWKDSMTKLRAWELTQYSRVAFLDGDMVLNRCMDGLFDDPATQLIPSRFDVKSPQNEAEVPEKYVLATIAEANPFHGYPPKAENGDFKDPNYFDAGFFVFSPSVKLFEHFKSIMKLENRFDPRYPEQNLMNYAYRRDGRMPWQTMDYSWNIRFPSIFDKESGVASLHDKWWSAHMDKKLQPYYDSVRWRMEGFYEVRSRGLSR